VSYETLSAWNPRLIYTSVTPCGDLGPAVAWRTTDIDDRTTVMVVPPMLAG
jgi:crotonobetainyl-CoA:carnitine CoA-transferase CaiB-like acyl-CoA transferase